MTAKVLDNPALKVVRKIDPGYRAGMFELVSPMRTHWPAKHTVVSVPVGFRTNFASIPRGFRNLMPINANHRLAAVFHDYLYNQSGVLDDVTEFVNANGTIQTTNHPQTVYYSRADADRVFYDLMRAEGVGLIKARTMYSGVRVFGGLWQRIGSGGWKKAKFV